MVNNQLNSPNSFGKRQAKVKQFQSFFEAFLNQFISADSSFYSLAIVKLSKHLKKQ
jgi:hypothetical protein